MLENGYFFALLYLKAILYDTEDDSKYRDVASVTAIVKVAKIVELRSGQTI